MLSFVRMIGQRIDLYSLSYLDYPDSGVRPELRGSDNTIMSDIKANTGYTLSVRCQVLSEAAGLA
jgi:hypothetical protein